MNIDHVLHLLDEFALAMRDQAKNIASGNGASAMLLNQQRERLREAIRGLADPKTPQEERASVEAAQAITAAAQPPKPPPATSGLTTDPNDPRLKRGPGDTAPVPQNEVYLVLSPEERAKGFVRPYRDAYKHVGLRPTYPLRDLTEEERARWVSADDGDEAFEKFEEYPAGSERSSATGRFWTRKELQPACGSITTMGRALSETYARDPSFYGATYCVKCAMHKPVAEFRWYEMDGTIGPVVGS